MKVLRVKILVASVVALSVLTGCGSTNPFNVPEGEGAFLQNQVVKEGKAMYRYRFLGADGEFLDPGLLSTTNVYYALYTIPSGEVWVKIQIDYFPKFTVFSYANPRTILRAISFVAAEGQTYQIACKVQDDRAHIWIEDAAGNQVSETVTAGEYYGYGLPDPAP